MKAQQLISLVVVSTYMIKSGAKLLGGFLMGIPALIADGLHSLFDILEHIFLVIGGYFARKQDRENYPLDRQPLIDLLGLMIYAGLFIFGITLLWKLVKLVIAMFVNFGVIKWHLSEFFKPEKINIETGNMHFLLIASCVMLLSYVISELVYRYEVRLAKEYRIREMIADAAELRTDGWLELGMGVGLLVGWVVAFFFDNYKTDHNPTDLFNYINGIIMGFIGVYLMAFAWPQFWENFNNLMNRALEKNERLLLKKTISARLPIGCSVIEPLVCYHRGDQLFIKGHLSIDPAMMNSSDLIIRNAELVTKSFFSNSEKTIYVQFSPFFTISKSNIDLELGKVIRDAFKISEQSPAGEAFKLLRKGNLDQSLQWVKNNIHTGRRQKLFSIYICAEATFRKWGTDTEETEKALQKINNALKEAAEDEDIKLFLFSWLLIFYSGFQVKSDDVNKEIEILKEKINYWCKEGRSENINDYFFAEAYFALGFSWERSADYNLKVSREYYRKSEYYYKRGGFRFEMDRLYNTWGHIQSLINALGDAELHLGFAQEVRELKEDLHGLTYTYGCLADLYGKTGNFRKAQEYYEKDIVLLKQLNISHPLPGLLVKKSEQLVKEGLITKNTDLIEEAIENCKNVTGKLNNPFFAYKGIVKGLLALVALSKHEDEKRELLAEISECLEKTIASSSYEKAFLHRLTGRLAGFKGNYVEAKKELINSRNLFESMKDPMHESALSMQAIVSGLETCKWNLFDDNYGFYRGANECLSVNSLKAYIVARERMLGALTIRVNELLSAYEMVGNNPEKQAVMLNQLIWFLEG